jgi:hypothetical protein
MNEDEFLAYAKSRGIVLTQSLLYKYTEIALTSEQERDFLNGGYLPIGTDPQKVKDLALKWTEDQVFERIPHQHNLAYC